MNSKINIVEILKGCPQGTKLWSPLFGEVTLLSMDSLIAVKTQMNSIVMFNKYGIFTNGYEECGAECLLFPSKENRDWSSFKPNKSKFDPKTLNPFDKVLVQYSYKCTWRCEIFSHIVETNYFVCSSGSYKYIIPYNKDTKHLVGTEEEAPEYYRYWE